MTISHDDIPGLMPAMTMEFVPARAEILDGIEPGQAVRFEVVRAVEVASPNILGAGLRTRFDESGAAVSIDPCDTVGIVGKMIE